MGFTDNTTKNQVIVGMSMLALVVGLGIGLFILAEVGTAILAFILFSVVPALLGVEGLRRTEWGLSPGTEPASDEDLLAELKRRYANGQLSEVEMERKVETLLTADEDLSGDRSHEPEQERVRR